jgi:hypothetical protein
MSISIGPLDIGMKHVILLFILCGILNEHLCGKIDLQLFFYLALSSKWFANPGQQRTTYVSKDGDIINFRI